MKLFVVFSRFPLPLDKGDKLRAYYQLVDLSKSFKITLVCLTEKDVDQKDHDHIAEMVDELHVFKIGKTSQIFRAFAGLFSSQPIQVRMFHSKRIGRKVNRLIKRVEPDHIYCQLVRTSEYVKHEHNIRKTIDYMDALSTGMMRMSADSGFIMKRIYKLESKRLARYENLVFDYFDNHTIISEQDRDLIFHPEQKRISVIPNGVNFESLSPVEIEKRYDLVFHGNMNYPPNVASALYIGHEIMPKLDSKVTLLISGTKPHADVKALESDRVTVSGWVDDIRKAYCASHIFVAPMLINTGLQNKILEAMSLGIPCITTTMANNAIGADPGVEIILADSPEAFAESIQRLLSDENLRHDLSIKAQAFVRKTYNWQDINANLAALFTTK